MAPAEAHHHICREFATYCRCIRRRTDASHRELRRCPRTQRRFAHTPPIFRLRINAVSLFSCSKPPPVPLATRDWSAFQRFDISRLPKRLTCAATCTRHFALSAILKTLTRHGRQRAPDVVYRPFAQIMSRPISCNDSPLALMSAGLREHNGLASRSRNSSPSTELAENTLTWRALTFDHPAWTPPKLVPNPLTATPPSELGSADRRPAHPSRKRSPQPILGHRPIPQSLIWRLF